MMRRLLLLLLVSCGGQATTIPEVRFVNAPPVHAVNDRRDVPKQPKEREFARYLHNYDALFHSRVTKPLELKRARRAFGVNALDEVPNSTWFTNRIGVRDVSPDEIANPPGSIGNPEQHKPWTIVSSKQGGMTIGFIMKDARGEKFLLKFDPRGYPEAETAAQVIVGKLLWAFGYNVTDDYVVYLKKEDLELAPDASFKDGAGRKAPLDQATFDKMLASVEAGKDGTIRGLASYYLKGKPLGGFPPEGIRPDDPNDRIAHEMRRDLRGGYVLFSWLDHTDLHGANMLDMYVEDPADPKRHYIKHYFVDFGITLGFGATKNRELRYGYEYHVDWGAIAKSLFTLGLVHRPWEDRAVRRPKGVGMYEIAHYDPGTWRALTPAFTPIYVADRIDKFWASKIVMKLTRDHIRAAVESARLSDPRATRWLTEALIERQRKTAKYWFERVNPVDEMAVSDRELCFKDLAIVYAVEPARDTEYTLTYYDRDQRPFSSTRLAAAGSGVTCGELRLSASSDSYTIVRIRTQRPPFDRSTYVHIARDRDGAARVIGIWRE
jgi:hypothetical protein